MQDLSAWPGIKPEPHAREVQILDYWIAREVFDRLFLKRQVVNILDFTRLMVSVTASQFCLYSMKAAIDSM